MAKEKYISKGTGSKIIRQSGNTTVVKTRSGTKVFTAGELTRDIKSFKSGYSMSPEKRVKKLVQETNKRLKSLEKSRGSSSTWATRKLQNRLNTKKASAWSKLGRVKPKKNLTKTELANLERSLQDFLSSKTSTNKGIKEARRNTIKSLKQTLGDDSRFESMTDKEAEYFYNMLENKDFQTYADMGYASSAWVEINDAIKNKTSKESFLGRWNNYVTKFVDIDEQEKVMRLYDKYIVPKL